MFTMTGNVLRNLLGKSATRDYPAHNRGNFPGYRGRLENRIEDCIFCKTCQVKCPSQCITVDAKAGIWECDPLACVYCGVCVDHCPVTCLYMTKEHKAPFLARETMRLQGTPKKKKKDAAPPPASADPEVQAAQGIQAAPEVQTIPEVQAAPDEPAS